MVDEGLVMEAGLADEGMALKSNVVDEGLVIEAGFHRKDHGT